MVYVFVMTYIASGGGNYRADLIASEDEYGSYVPENLLFTYLLIYLPRE